jgi:hypothetical protein
LAYIVSDGAQGHPWTNDLGRPWVFYKYEKLII